MWLSNAFNAVNRLESTLHNIHGAPVFAPFAANMYRVEARLFFGGTEKPSAEPATQGNTPDPKESGQNVTRLAGGCGGNCQTNLPPKSEHRAGS